ncbi:MAG: PilZ domain-containing protein [Myxococcaceae bacterium]|nr:PilZ domain-containing protein [Myxococcaceae bacterium]
MAPPNPVRLRVQYNSAQGLLAEFTRSIGHGSVSIASKKSVPVGTRFVFEMTAKGSSDVVEVLGEVKSVKTSKKGTHLLTVVYEVPDNRESLDGILQKIFDSQKFEKVRKHARIPLTIAGKEEKAGAPPYLVRDLSLGGLGVEIDGPVLPPWVRPGEPFLLELEVSIGVMMLHGEVVWAAGPKKSQAGTLSPSFGVQFGKLRADTVERLKHILMLRALPPPPWKSRVSFGREAVSRMP